MYFRWRNQTVQVWTLSVFAPLDCFSEGYISNLLAEFEKSSEVKASLFELSLDPARSDVTTAKEPTLRAGVDSGPKPITSSSKGSLFLIQTSFSFE